MKKYLLILLLSILSLTTHAQNFVIPTNQWNVSVYMNFGGTYTEIFKILGDSVVGSISYKKVFVSYDSTLTNLTYKGLLREESNKVYYIPENNNTEGLLYDFNLNAGDTALIISDWIGMQEPKEFICQSVDSINYNGAYYKRWNFSFPFDQWIEGIGSIIGPLYSSINTHVSDLFFTLLCFSQNDNLLYMDPNATKCFYSTVGINDLDKEANINLFPNPIQSGQSIKVKSKYSIQNIEIYNAVGMRLAAQFTVQGETATINTANLPNGIYLFRVSAEDNLTFVKKVIVK